MSLEEPDIDIELAVVPQRIVGLGSSHHHPQSRISSSPNLTKAFPVSSVASLYSSKKNFHQTLTIINLPSTPVPKENGKKQQSQKRKRKPVMKVQSRPRLLNNVLFSVGFLDLASASDFAANIWNEYPVPSYAKALMIIGGLLALAISLFAIKDFRLSYPNYAFLRSERQFLKSQRKQISPLHDDAGFMARDLDSCLEVNFRELGGEVARLGMDAIMGFGVFLVGIGTLLALGGENWRIFHASNLLSGYIGNSPIALYGLMNSAWSIYIWKRTYKHSQAGRKNLRGRKVGELLERRIRLLRLYSALYGVSGFFTGVGSLISSTMWFGYVISFPWIIAAIFCNYLLRERIAYDRPSIVDLQRNTQFTKDSITEELEILLLWKSLLLSNRGDVKLSTLVLTTKTLAECLQFLLKYDLFDDFCWKIAHQDPGLLRELYGEAGDTTQGITGQYTIDSELLVSVDWKYHPRLLGLAVEVVDQFGVMRLKQRKRFLVEALGCFLCDEEEEEEEQETSGGLGMDMEMQERGRDSG